MDSLTRYKDRRVLERERLYALLDSEWTCVVSTIADGQPWAVPMLYARDGDSLLIHGSTGAGALRNVAAGAPAVISVMVLDAFVFAQDLYNTAAQYRSATIRGTLEKVDPESADDALTLLSDGVMPGRSAEVRGSTRKEVVATLALRIPLLDDNWILKETSGEPDRPDGEVEQGVWAGRVAIGRHVGAVTPATWLKDSPPEPAAVDAWRTAFAAAD